MPEIFKILGEKKKGAGGEIQLTDAMATMLKQQPFFGFTFKGTRFDCGDRAGFLKANLSFAMEIPEIKAELKPFINNLQK